MAKVKSILPPSTYPQMLEATLFDTRNHSQNSSAASLYVSRAAFAGAGARTQAWLVIVNVAFAPGLHTIEDGNNRKSFGIITAARLPHESCHSVRSANGFPASP